MRLTVHVTGAKSYKVEKKDSKGNIVTYYKTPSTLSFKNVKKGEEVGILDSLRKEKLVPFKHYFSNIN